MDIFWMKLNELLEKCNFSEAEKRLLEDFAEYLVYPDKEKTNPRSLCSRCFRKLKESGNAYADYRNLIRKYQKKIK